VEAAGIEPASKITQKQHLRA